MSDDNRHDKRYGQCRTEDRDEAEPGALLQHVKGLFEVLFIHSFLCCVGAVREPPLRGSFIVQGFCRLQVCRFMRRVPDGKGDDTGQDSPGKEADGQQTAESNLHHFRTKQAGEGYIHTDQQGRYGSNSQYHQSLADQQLLQAETG